MALDLDTVNQMWPVVFFISIIIFAALIARAGRGATTTKWRVILSILPVACTLVGAFVLDVRSKKHKQYWNEGPDYRTIIAQILPLGVNTNAIIKYDYRDSSAIHKDHRLRAFPLKLVDAIQLYEQTPKRTEAVSGWLVGEKYSGYPLDYLHKFNFIYDDNVRNFVPKSLKSRGKRETEQILVIREHFISGCDLRQPGAVGRQLEYTYDHYMTVIDIPSRRLSPTIWFETKGMDALQGEDGTIRQILSAWDGMSPTEPGP